MERRKLNTVSDLTACISSRETISLTRWSMDFWCFCRVLLPTELQCWESLILKKIIFSGLRLLKLNVNPLSPSHIFYSEHASESREITMCKSSWMNWAQQVRSQHPTRKRRICFQNLDGTFILSKLVLHSSYLLIEGAISHVQGGCKAPSHRPPGQPASWCS